METLVLSGLLYMFHSNSHKDVLLSMTSMLSSFPWALTIGRTFVTCKLIRSHITDFLHLTFSRQHFRAPISVHFYHPRMWVGNVFSHVCLSVCLSVCVSVCVSVCLCVCLSVFLPVQAITFEPLDIETSFLVCRYILTISRSSLSIKVIGSRSRSYKKKW